MISHESIQRQYWDEMAKDFADNPAAAVHWVDGDSAIPMLMFDEVSAYLQKKSKLCANQNVLEIGCGNGLMLKSLANVLDESVNFYGTDISPELLKYVELPNCRVDCAEAAKIPHADNTFHLVFIHSVVQYFSSLEYLEVVMEEIKRVLVPNGVCVILDIPNQLFERDMKSQSLVRCVLKKLLGYKVYQFIKAAKVLLSKKAKEKVAGKMIEIPKFEGLYVPPDFFLKYFQSFKDCALELQPYQAKPLVYRKYRYNFVAIGMIK